MNKTEVKVIEIDTVKLNPKAKYIILLDPQYAFLLDVVRDELIHLIGESFVLLPMGRDQLKVLEVLPEGSNE